MPVFQLYMGKKNFDCQKAERWFKERGIKTQGIDLKKKPLSNGEFNSVLKSVGLMELIDTEAAGYSESPLRFSSDPAFIKNVLFENQHLLKTPIVRFGQKATVGHCPEVWAQWISKGE